jgi:hypothetical protein
VTAEKIMRAWNAIRVFAAVTVTGPLRRTIAAKAL